MSKVNFRINFLLFLLFSIILMFLTVNLRISTSNPASLYSSTNAPEFYGLTRAIIKVGDEFSLDDTRFRIFARDFEDGDLTSKIVANSNVDTSIAGIYTVTYEIVDSHMNMTSLVVPIEVVDDVNINRYYERTLYSLPSVWNMSLAGTSRGNNHDRQMIGFYMKAGSEIVIKKISGKSDLTLTYLNNDSQLEKNFTINEEPLAITSTSSGVPFIKTTYSEKDAVIIGIEVVNNSGVEELPYYHYGDDENMFFKNWNENIDSFSVVENEDITVLVPYADRTLLLKEGEGNFQTLSEFMTFWSKVIDKYDAYLGLSYDPIDAIDQNVKTKYFIKANIHGAGLAYYSVDHVGYNSSSVAGFFNMGWAGLHELAHGYQGSLAHSGIEQGEVSNNILGHYVQMDDSFYTASSDWLGSISDIESKYNVLRKEGKVYSDYDSYGYQGQLYILINLLDTFNSEETYAKINKIYRRTLYNGKTLTAGDAYVLAFYELYNVNVTYYLESYGIEISNDVKEKVSNSKILYFLNDLVGNDVLAEEIKSALNKDGLYSLVSTGELKSYNLYGNANIKLDIDDLSQLYGKKLIINGNDESFEIIIDSNVININNLNIGVYEIIVPCPKNNVYEYSSNIYLEIKNNNLTEVTVTFNDGASSLAYDEILYFKGLGNWVFATMKFKNENEIIINTNNGSPHSYFNDSYLTVKIADSNNQLIFEKDYIGNITYLKEEKSVFVNPGYKISIMHREASSRLEVWSTYLNIENNLLSKPKNNTTTYVVGDYGLYVENNTLNQYELFKDKVDKYAEKLSNTFTEQEVSNKNLKSEAKRVLFTSILKLDELHKNEYLDKYKYLYNGGKPKLNYNTITVNQHDYIDIKTLLKGIDNEDGIFVLTDNNFAYGIVDTSTAGVYEIPFILQDTDGNSTQSVILLTINSREELPEDENLECPEGEFKECEDEEKTNKNENVGNNLTNKNNGTKVDENDEDDSDQSIMVDEYVELGSTEEESRIDDNSYSEEIIRDLYISLFIVLILAIIYLRGKKRKLKTREKQS